jgi:hypothetical protein
LGLKQITVTLGLGAAGLVAILNSPAISSMAQSVLWHTMLVQKITEPLVIEQDLVQKITEPLVIEQDISEKIPPKEKRYYELVKVFNDSALVFKGKCTDVTIAYCSAVDDLCASYRFRTQVFYKLHGKDMAQKYFLEDDISLFSDVRSLDASASRFDRAVMNGGANGGIYEPTAMSIMPGDNGIFLAYSKDGQFIITHYLLDTKKNNKIIDEILKAQAKK